MSNSMSEPQEVIPHDFYTKDIYPAPWEISPPITIEEARAIEEKIDSINLEQILHLDEITPKSVVEALRDILSSSVIIQETIIYVSRMHTHVKNALLRSERYHEKLINLELLEPSVKSAGIPSQAERRVKAMHMVEKWRQYVHQDENIPSIPFHIGELQQLELIWSDTLSAVIAKSKLLRQAEQFGKTIQKIMATSGITAVNGFKSRYIDPDEVDNVEESS